MELTVVITGCSSGIGRASSLYFAERGHRVLATSRNGEDLQSLQKINPRILTYSCDVSSDSSVQAAVTYMREQLGRVDVLINNAGFALIGAVESIPLEKARYQFEVNTLGVMRMIQGVVPLMRAGKRGRIVNVSSIAGRTLVPLAGWYSASKFALEALNDALRFELGPQGIEVISVLPGPVLSSFIEKLDVATLPSSSPPLYAMYMRHYEARRARRRPFAVTPERIAEVVFKGATTARPRSRYFVTLPARVFNVARKFVPDKVWDRLTKRAYGFDAVDRLYRAEMEPVI